MTLYEALSLASPFIMLGVTLWLRREQQNGHIKNANDIAEITEAVQTSLTIATQAAARGSDNANRITAVESHPALSIPTQEKTP